MNLIATLLKTMSLFQEMFPHLEPAVEYLIVGTQMRRVVVLDVQYSFELLAAVAVHFGTDGERLEPFDAHAAFANHDAARRNRLDAACAVVALPAVDRLPILDGMSWPIASEPRTA